MMPDILKSQWRKARKRHVCSFCNQYIEPGEWYKGDWPSVEEGEKAIRAWNRRADDGSA